MEKIENSLGHIIIYRCGFNHKTIRSNSEFFNGGIIIKDDGVCLKITKPTLDYRGKFLNPTKYTNNYQTCIASEIPLGKYYFDEDDSTEDELIVYYES